MLNIICTTASSLLAANFSKRNFPSEANSSRLIVLYGTDGNQCGNVADCSQHVKLYLKHSISSKLKCKQL